MTVEKFWARVRGREDVDACWLWTGTLTPKGYGVATWAGKSQGAHRVAYMLEVGPITTETLDHLCRNRACVNPSHLEPVSYGVNTLRGEGPTAKNKRKRQCENGHEFTPENTRRTSTRRQCRACDASRVYGPRPSRRYRDTGRTACQHGHTLTDETSYLSPAGRRICRGCERQRHARRKQRGRRTPA